MFCAKCGANNPDDAAVCSACGAELEPQEETAPLTLVRPVPGTAAPEAGGLGGATAAFGSSGDMERREGTISLSAADGDTGAQAQAVPSRAGLLFYSLFGVAAAAVIILALMLSGRSAQTTAVQAAEALFNPRTEELYALVPRTVMRTNAVSKADYRAAARTADMNFRIAHTEMEAAQGADIKYAVQVRNLKSASAEELTALQEQYGEKYGLSVSDAGIVKVRVTATAGGDDDTYNLRVPVVKIGRSWYLDGDWAGMGFLEGYEEVLHSFDLS